MNKIFAILGGLGAGALIMYLFDPQGGGRRRALIRDKAVGISNDVSETVGKKARHLSNKAQGLMHEAGSLVGVKDDAGTQSSSAGAQA